MRIWYRSVGMLAVFAALAFVVGCTPTDTTKDTGPKPVAKGDDKEISKEDGKHSGWWCDEHGVQEAKCSMCSSKVAAEFKKKGDWCEKHERAKSQCFICDPKAKEKFAAEYRAKYGKEPPPTEEEEEAAKKGKKDEKK